MEKKTSDQKSIITNLEQTLQTEPVRQLQELAQKIDHQQPTPTDLQALRHLLTEHPDLWRAVADLAHHAAHRLINHVQHRPIFTESLKHGLDTLKADLAYHTASPLERLLIEQVLLCWLRLNVAELTYTDLIDQAPTFAAATHWDKRLSTAQRRFLQACQTLARIRKLTRTTPALQVNIATQGSQQLNILNQGPQDNQSMEGEN